MLTGCKIKNTIVEEILKLDDQTEIVNASESLPLTGCKIKNTVVKEILKLDDQTEIMNAN